jgi:hypothetical protein
MTKMSDAFNEILSRLDALVVALEGYESDYRTNFVINLKTSLVAAAEELSKSENDTLKDFDHACNLPEAILDTLIVVQTDVNNVLIETEQSGHEKAKHCKTSELVLNLAELREAISFAVHKTTTLKEDETIKAIINLNEPLIDLKLSLTGDCVPEEILVIKNMISPLDSLQKVINTVIQYKQTSELKIECSDVIKPIYTTIEDLKQQILVTTKNLEREKSHNDSVINENISLEIQNSSQQIISNLQMASELSIIHFEFGKFLEKYEKLKNIPQSIFSTIFELKQCIANASIEIDKITISTEPNIDKFIEKLSNLKEPLLKFQNSLLYLENEILEQGIIVELLKPLER